VSSDECRFSAWQHLTAKGVALGFRGCRLIGLAAIVAASTGNATSSTVLTSSGNSAEVDMEFFSCFVDALPVKGRFRRVDFKDGEKIDFVVTVKEGVGEVHGARDPSQRFIWTLPYQTRGHIAQKMSDIVSSLTISAACAILFSILTFYDDPEPIREQWIYVIKLTVMNFLITLFVNFMARRPFYKFPYEATKVFSTFEFNDPARLNLADKGYCKETGEPRSSDKPLRYRYESSIASYQPETEAADSLRNL
jgi:hypothetical protein